jgi:hypothetical protein
MSGFLSAFELVFAYAVPCGALVVAWRLWRQRLSSRYRCFFALLLYMGTSDFVFLALKRTSSTYFWAFVVYQVILWILQILVLLELFSLVLDSYRGIASAGRDFIRIAFVVAVLLTLTITALNHQAGPGEFPVLESFLLVSRVVSFMILGFLALMILFLLWFPLPLSRNALAYLGGYSLYFVAQGSSNFAANLLGPEAYQWLSAATLLVTAGCLIFWAFRLSSAGETSAVRAPNRWAPAEEERLVQQLEAINATLARARK